MLSDRDNLRLVEIETQLRLSDPAFVVRMAHLALLRRPWYLRWLRRS